jgi:outer membrane protein TolC
MKKKKILIEICIIIIIINTSCSSDILNRRAKVGIPEQAGRAWIPKDGEKPVVSIPSIQIPVDISALKGNLTLVNLIDLALRYNALTKATWYAALGASADYRSKRGNYYPDASIDANIVRAKGTAVGGRFEYEQTSFSPSLSLNMLIFNFGGREAEIEEARQTLIAANYSNNLAIQNVILQVEKAYYNYLYSKALLQAAEVSVKNAQINYEAAQERLKAGLATIADVLQAKTAVSQAQLSLDIARGQIEIMRGTLATAVGLPANLPYDVEDILPENITIEKQTDKVENLIQQAFEKRPDLAALRAQLLKAEAHVKNVKAKGLPSINASANIARTYYKDIDVPGNNYSATLAIKFPFFTGFSQTYDEIKAKAAVDEIREQLNLKMQEVSLQVWSSYYNLKTAEQKIKTSKDLLESAEENYRVALDRYKAGVGSILDLLAAQSALENARAQNVKSRTDWFLSLVQLAYDTGSLEINTANNK